MPKLENAHLVQIELEDGRAKISQSEYDLSPDEWYRRRADAFAQLRRIGFIPNELLDLVERFRGQTLVHPFVYRPTKKMELRLGVEIAEQQKKEDKDRRLRGSKPALNPTSDASQGAKWTASETLAFLL